MLLDFDKHFKTFYNALKVKLKSHRGSWNQNDSNADDYIKGKTHWIDNDGNIHTLDERYIPDTIARTSDVAASLSSKAEAVHGHDMSEVNDLQKTFDDLHTALDEKASSWNDLTDKPFYSELGENIISNQVRASGESTSSVIDMELAKAILEYPEKVVITENTMNGPKVYKLGEITSDNGYTTTWNVPDPYGEGWYENRAGSLSITPSNGSVETGYNALSNNTLTISVAVPVEIIHPIDNKFMPEGYPKAERKEIVRSVRLNATGPAAAKGEDVTIANLIYNNPESVTAYHKDRPCKYLGIRDDSSSYQTNFSYGIDDVVIVQLSVAKSNGELSGDITAYFNDWDYVNFVDVEVPDVEETVEKLDPKFVEPSYFRINISKSGDTYSLVDVTGFEIQEAWESGKILYGVVHESDASGVFDSIYQFSYYNGQVGKYVDLVRFSITTTALKACKLRVSWDLYPDKVVYTESSYAPTSA